MSNGLSLGSKPAVAGGLDVHLQEFLVVLAAAGYTKTTLHSKRWLIRRFVRWARNAQLAASDLDEACIATFLTHSQRRGRKPRKMERSSLQQFLDHLRVVKDVPPLRTSKPPSSEVLVRRYLKHLRSERGLCERSVAVYSPFARAFVEAHGLPAHLASLDASAVRRYLLKISRNRSGSFVKLLAAALRSFLRFLFLDDGTRTDLSLAVPPVRRWRLAGVPPLLTPEQVEQVIAAADHPTASGYRAHAVLLLLARLGLRAGEVAALELDDIRWDIGEIIVRGKGRRYDQMPLLDDVGAALALYIREARGQSSSRRVFLRRCAPHVGLSGPTAVCLIARKAVRQAGLLPDGRVGAHVFRHSLATRMIQKGASLEEIAQVLRHRTVDTTQLYAKVQFEALGDVALPWPNVEAQS